MNENPIKVTNNVWLIEEENHYKNNGEQCCQICHAYMTEEEYDCGGGECADCRDEVENEFAQV